jgi:hypothetical protein
MARPFWVEVEVESEDEGMGERDWDEEDCCWGRREGEASERDVGWSFRLGSYKVVKRRATKDGCV